VVARPGYPAVFWPAAAPLEETVPAFVTAFVTLGFQPCAEVTPDADFEFIAIFAQPDGTPTHAARRLANGNWTSKLGNQVDIEHPLDAICGHLYGQVVQYLLRPSHQ
jgi:hypothetical protein